jgi:uncharacterized protein YbcV (DUF1398 family)
VVRSDLHEKTYHSFFIGNKNLSGVKDKEEKQDISEISDQNQNNQINFKKL